ncbi:hypothetical protein [Amycolatopsis pigmentata]|uniref:Secreted protein n=1 Tax=Amycolatopsis pigmentata TaxID=450801 RepID=A0ABW5G0Q3_9PSEU
MLLVVAGAEGESEADREVAAVLCGVVVRVVVSGTVVVDGGGGAEVVGRGTGITGCGKPKESAASTLCTPSQDTPVAAAVATTQADTWSRIRFIGVHDAIAVNVRMAYGSAL